MRPEEITTSLEEINRLAAELGRPAIRATLVAPQLDPNPQRAVEQLAKYEKAGTERIILAPTGPDWRRDHELAAKLRTAYEVA
ncbi:MAG TPA: hypothetical protein VFG33_03715 [Kribbella sp.]|nr:hypothetical protein [Kribbella sp.]